MKNYDQYTLEDFVQDFYFRQWVQENLDPHDKFWETWANANPEKQLLVEEARSMVIGLAYAPEQADSEEISLAISRIKAELHKPSFFKRKWLLYAAAALVPFTAVIGFLLSSGLSSEHTEDSRLTVAGSAINWRSNDTDDIADILLEDGSTVRLAPQSRLGMTQQFAQANRFVWLEGEAVFDVVKKSNQPFIVHSHNIVTKVLGTVFQVKAYEKDETVSVSVTSGKVTVQKQATGTSEASEGAPEMILTPNQQAVISRINDKFIKTLIDAPVVIREPVVNRHFNFNDTPISEVFGTLEQAYGIPIAYESDRLAKCNLTARLGEEDLFHKLELICETIQASYRVADGQILINGVGCD